jgi:hypothetical protein
MKLPNDLLPRYDALYFAFVSFKDSDDIVDAELDEHGYEDPFFQLAQRCCSGMFFRQASTCAPHPCHVGLPQLEHLTLKHILLVVCLSN